MQSCINIACQGQDYVNIVNADATLRQDVNVAWNPGCYATFRSVIKLLIIDSYFFIDHCFLTWAFSRLT